CLRKSLSNRAPRWRRRQRILSAWKGRRSTSAVASARGRCPMLVAFSVTPIGSASASVGDAVADAVRVVRASGLPNRNDAMFTTIEGEWDEVMDVVRRAMLAAGRGYDRVSLVLKADERAGVENAMQSKVESVERRLQG